MTEKWGGRQFTTGPIGLLLLGLVHSLSLFAPTLRWEMRSAF